MDVKKTFCGVLDVTRLRGNANAASFVKPFSPCIRTPRSSLVRCFLEPKFSIKATLNWSPSIISSEGNCRIDLPTAFYLLRTSQVWANEENRAGRAGY